MLRVPRGLQDDPKVIVGVGPASKISHVKALGAWEADICVRLGRRGRSVLKQSQSARSVSEMD